MSPVCIPAWLAGGATAVIVLLLADATKRWWP